MSGYDEQVYDKPFDIKIWFRLWPFIKKYGWKLVAICLMMGITAFIDIIMPVYQKEAISRFILPGTTEGLVPYALLYLGIILFQALNVIIFARLAMSSEMLIGRDIRSALFRRLQELSFSYYNVTPVGYILARVMNDVNKIASQMSWGVVDIVWSLFYVVGVFVTMLIVDVTLGLMLMLLVPVIAIATVYFQKRILTANREVRRQNSKMTGAYNEGISGARTAKTLGVEDKNSDAFEKITGKMYGYSVKASLLNAVFVPVVVFCSSIAVALVLYYGGNLTLQGLMDFATFSLFITYAVSIFEPIQQFARIIADFISLQASIERVTDLLEKEPDIQDTPEVIEKYGDSFHPKKENWEPIKGDIEFDHVTFRYPDGTENVLEDFCLKVPAGTTVAIVGETGAGKSTIVNLACRFFEPTSGRILIDGRDYRERSMLWLHSNLGYVLQSPHLFSGTIRENIRYGNPDATDEQVEAAAKLVAADRVVEKLDKGYDSDVGEGGDKLSTGEKQLISFARAVLNSPPIFVLDEATSSIDTETEQLIQQAITKLLEGRTSFVVAHRLSTIRHADVILVVEDGKIVERGTHDELMEKRGAYHDLYTRQFMEELEKHSWQS
ncbi:MAG: ABC transporter ATP-binding protein [Christensenellales bacterium]